MAPDGSCLAVVCTNETESVLFVASSNSVPKWRLGKIVPSCVCVDPSGKIVATGDSEGGIAVWSIKDGSHYSLPRAGREPICSIALHRSSILSEKESTSPLNGFLLATGSSGSSLLIWNLATSVVQAHCRGSEYSIDAVAFSPDGTLLASGGSGPATLWDVATGSRLLVLSSGYGVGTLRFSPQGDKLAVGIVGPFSRPQTQL